MTQILTQMLGKLPVDLHPFSAKLDIDAEFNNSAMQRVSEIRRLEIGIHISAMCPTPPVDQKGGGWNSSRNNFYRNILLEILYRAMPPAIPLNYSV